MLLISCKATNFILLVVLLLNDTDEIYRHKIKFTYLV